MKVRELIAELQKQPPELEVTVWDDAEDDYIPVVQVLWEDGTSEVNLLTEEVETLPAEPDPDCPEGTCYDGCIHK